MDINERIGVLLSRWEQQALPIDREWREALAVAEKDGIYRHADELSADRNDVYAFFAEEAIELLQKICDAGHIDNPYQK